MPRYYFSLLCLGEIVTESRGGDFYSLTDAREYAATWLRDAAADHLTAGREIEGCVIEICDANGVVRGTVTTYQAIEWLINRGNGRST